MSRNKMVNGANKRGKLEHETLRLIGKLRRGSSLTRKDQLNCLGRIARTMQCYGLNSIKHMKPVHLQRYFAELHATGLSAGRIANHATAMRTICRMIGKLDIVPSNRLLGCNRDIENRTKHADERLDPAKYAEVKAQLSENNQIAYDMARNFGLRQKETLLSQLTICRDGIEYLVVEGGKGGRPREVPVTTAEQRAVLDRNAAYRDSHNGKLIDEGKTLKQGIKQLQNELAAASATRKSGANMHTLRREWIIERCQIILAAPEEARPALLEALVESVGHGRIEVLRCYTRLLD